MYYQDRFFLMPQRASVFCNFYIRVDREALVSERALDVESVAFKAMSTKKNHSLLLRARAKAPRACALFNLHKANTFGGSECYTKYSLL
jgi:hypothetical protein